MNNWEDYQYPELKPWTDFVVWLTAFKTTTLVEPACSIITAPVGAVRESVTMISFGNLHPWKQTSRPARNPKTGEPVIIAPRTSIKFRAGIKLLEDLNK